MYSQFVLLSLKVFHQSESKRQKNRNISDLKLPKALEACTLQYCHCQLTGSTLGMGYRQAIVARR